jgi:hypothetical protein
MRLSRDQHFALWTVSIARELMYRGPASGGCHKLLSEDERSVLVTCGIISITFNPLLFRAIVSRENWLRRRPKLWRFLSQRAEQGGAEINVHTQRQLTNGNVSATRAVIVGYCPVGLLDEACRKQQFGDGWFKTIEDVPRQAISMSVRQIMKSNVIACTVPRRAKGSSRQELGQRRRVIAHARFDSAGAREHRSVFGSSVGIAARYAVGRRRLELDAWADNTIRKVRNNAWLPLTPFSTDDWHSIATGLSSRQARYSQDKESARRPLELAHQFKSECR